MSARACPDDTLVRARRGELLPEEAGTLEAHLALCASCRMSAALGRAVGPLPPPDDEDEALARRLIEHQLGAGAPSATVPVVAFPPRRRRSPGRSWALAASLLLMASAASAAYWTVRVKTARRAAAARAAWTPPARPSRTATPPAGATTGPPPLPLAPPTVPARPGPSQSRPVHAPAGATQTAAIDPETLLRNANEARQARRADEAARGYRALQARFPSSREAVLSHLSLGNLQLSQAAFSDALAQFQAYLRLRGDGAELAEEALLGEARALAALGRPAEERAVWQSLEARFPRSEYSWRARERLRELERGAGP